MTAPDYGHSFALWRGAAAEDWQGYTHHPFVEGLRDGSLPRRCFLNYLIQDYVFLVHFARAWSMAVVKSETLEEMKTCATTVDALVNHEMALHIRTCGEAGISEAAVQRNRSPREPRLYALCARCGDAGRFPRPHGGTATLRHGLCRDRATVGTDAQR